jgi:hypothetical protein
MTHRRFVLGCVAVSLGLALVLGGRVAVAAPLLGVAPWVGPYAQPVPPVGYPVPPALRVAPWSDPAAAAAAAHYRWRPAGPHRVAAPVWGTRHVPPPPFARPMLVRGAPWVLPPPRLADHRRVPPAVLAMNGQVYRFRPTAPWAAPAVAYGPPAPFHPGHAPAFAVPPWQRVAAAPAPWPAPSVAWSTAPVYDAAWAQAGPTPMRDGGRLYRFRPDARFAYGAGVPSSAPGGVAAGLYN